MNALRNASRHVVLSILFSSFILFAPLRGEDADKKPLPDDIQKIIAAGHDHNQAMAHLDYLTNRIGPRLTGSDNFENACEWTRDTFEKFGLKDAHLEKWADWPVVFNRGPWFGDM